MILIGETGKIGETWKRRAAVWLGQGITPRRLAFTLALGFTLGCVPVVGVPTVACTVLALALGLNLPAIQAANYAAMPFQLAMIVPFVRLGARVMGAAAAPAAKTGTLVDLAIHLGGMAGQALLGWLLVAAPAALLMTAVLTAMLRRVPALAGRD